MAFLRFSDTLVHPDFAAIFNGEQVTNKDRFTISLSSNRPLAFSTHYIQNKMTWVLPQFLAKQKIKELNQIVLYKPNFFR